MASQESGSKNLFPLILSELPWHDAEASAESVSKLYERVVLAAENSIDWYLRKKESRKRGALACSFFALAFLLLGMLVPATLLVDPEFPYPNLGYVLILASGACMLVNRLFGYSSGWMRYLRAAFTLKRQLEEFQLDWALVRSEMGGDPVDPKQTARLLNGLKRMTQQMNRLVEEETDLWLREFGSELDGAEGGLLKGPAFLLHRRSEVLRRGEAAASAPISSPTS